MELERLNTRGGISAAGVSEVVGTPAGAVSKSQGHNGGSRYTTWLKKAPGLLGRGRERLTTPDDRKKD